MVYFRGGLLSEYCHGHSFQTVFHEKLPPHLYKCGGRNGVSIEALSRKKLFTFVVIPTKFDI
jgi:hypothetical protein